MIDLKNGRIILLKNDIVLSNKLTKNELLASCFYKEYFNYENDMGNSYTWIYFKPFLLINVEMIISICFKDYKIYQLNMSAVGEDFPTSWENWSEDGELKRKKIHDSFLSKNFSREANKKTLIPYPSTEYGYPWGRVCSVFDSSAGSSYIGISYK